MSAFSRQRMPGNYVLQKLIVCGEEHHVDAVLNTIINEEGVPSLFELAKKKYSSNVVEGLIVGAKAHHRAKLFAKMLEVRASSTRVCIDSGAAYIISLESRRNNRPRQALYCQLRREQIDWVRRGRSEAGVF